MEILHSGIDRSVNFVEQQLTGFIESRYVRKTDDYFICYLSSQTGCNRGCQFCHLTATGQQQFVDCTYDDFVHQAETVFRHYENDTRARYVHFNFMARGEPLANKIIERYADDILLSLGGRAKALDLFPKFNISTIMPLTMKRSLTEMFRLISPTIYYSIYSANPDFRAKWMPGAMALDDAIEMLRDYQRMTKKIVKLHGAFIQGENDSPEEVAAMLDAASGLRCEFNIVRYNPASPAQGRESEAVALIAAQIAERMPVKTIPRVGFDVKASCGMFV